MLVILRKKVQSATNQNGKMQRGNQFKKVDSVISEFKMEENFKKIWNSAFKQRRDG